MLELTRGTPTPIHLKVLDSSATTGEGLTGLTNASSGLIIAIRENNGASSTAYTVAGSNVETISTLGTYAAPTASKVRFKELDSTNHKGVYELHLEAATYSSTAPYLIVSLSGPTDAAETDLIIKLKDAKPAVTLAAGDVTGNLPSDVILIEGTDATTVLDGVGGSGISAEDVWTYEDRSLTEDVTVGGYATGQGPDELLTDLVTTADLPTNFADLAITATTGLVSTDEGADLLKLARADVAVSTGAIPYTLVYKEEGTANVLMTKELKDVSGGDISNVATVVAQRVAP